MKIKTKYGKELEIKENEIIEINSILGFENFSKFVIIETNSPLKWLQSIEESALAFVVVDPRDFFPDYEPDISSEELSSIGLNDIKEALILVIVSLPQGNPSGATANLLGPIVINPENRKGAQFISSNPEHSVKEPLFPHGMDMGDLEANKRPKAGSA